MNTGLVLHHCDPRQNFSARANIVLLKLHALLFRDLVVQDNFFVSELFFDVSRISVDGSFFELFESSIIKIAARDDGEDNLTSLKDTLLQKAKIGEYLPFEGRRGVFLYENPDFCRYLKRFDKALVKNSQSFVRWSPDVLASALRERMDESSRTGISGLPVLTAKKIFSAVDGAAKQHHDGRHSRTLYYQHIKTVKDPSLKLKLKRWVDTEYLRNLPDVLGHGTSLPQKLVRNIGAFDPFELLNDKRLISDSSVLLNADSVLLSPDFLFNISAESIVELRSLPEFEALQIAMAGNDKALMVVRFTAYLERLGEEAPRHYGHWKKRIQNLEKYRKARIALQHTADFLSVGIGSNNAKAAVALKFIKLFLSLLTKDEKDREAAIRAARKDLLENRFMKSTRTLSDVCHAADPRGRTIEMHR